MRIKKQCAIQIFLMVFLNSCAQSQLSEHPHADAAFSETKAKPTDNQQKQSLTTASNFIPSSQPHKAQRKFFNVSVHEISAREFFMGLVMDSKENIVVHPDVKGTISLVLKNVTLPEVMDVVEKVYGYDCKKTSMGYIIYPATLQTKIFKIDRLDLLREGRSNTLVTSGQQSNPNNQQGSYNQQGSSSQSSQQVVMPSQSGGNNPQGTNSTQNAQNNGSWIRTSTNTDFWDELNKTLHSIIEIDPQASVIINRQTGVIVARAKPMQLHEIEQFISTTQNQVGRQVILEAKIMEVILDSGHQDGVNWKILAQRGLDAVSVTTGFGIPNAAKFASLLTLGSGAGNSFSAMVEFLATQGKTNVLSSPRISTLNNQKAIIKVGSDEYFITGVSANSISTGNLVTGVNNTALPTASMAPFFSGIALDVIPQIDDYENITLHIHPSITKVQNLEKSFVIYNEPYSLPTALSTVRESDSIVKAQNGQVIVLGGLMQESEIENKEGLTGLASIPWIGHLFRVDTGTTQKSELVILLKASIIKEDSDWQSNLDSTKSRLENLEAQPLWK